MTLLFKKLVIVKYQDMVLMNPEKTKCTFLISSSFIKQVSDLCVTGSYPKWKIAITTQFY